MSSQFRVLITDGLSPEGIGQMKQVPGLEILEYSTIERDEIKKLLSGVDILIVRSRTQVDGDLLDSGKQLKLVIRAGIGLDNIDVPAATDRGVVVMNAPTGNIVTTGEHALAMLFAVSRHIPAADAMLRTGKWEKKKFQGNEIRGKQLGLVGLGNIGKAVAERAIGLGMTVCGFDPYISPEAAAKHRIKLVTMDELLATSDYISLHVPLTAGTKHLIGKEAFKKMKKGAYLINCARGGIVDEAALMEALDEKRLNGAALDVFEVEPLPANSPLLKRQDIVLTPHLGASTDEAQVQVGIEVAEQVAQYARDGVLKNAVNVPNITLEQLAVLKPYLTLCERLGSFIAQLGVTGTPKKLSVHYEGTVTQYNREILTLAVLKGFLAPQLSTPVNFVNAKKLVKERGLRIEESFDVDCADYAGLVEVTVEGEEPVRVAGTLFGKQSPRIVQIDRFGIDALPEGCLLYTRNIDTPGVIGAMGTLLGTEGVNIARMHLGRDPKKKEALAIINVDSEPKTSTLEKLRKTPGMVSVRVIHL